MSVRKTKEVRRIEILDAALVEFAELGLHGTSTEDIAQRAGISQPYVFRLFATKKELFKAVLARCYRETLEQFQGAAEGNRGPGALEAIAEMYSDWLWKDPTRLRLHMQAFAACGDPEIRAVVRDGVRDLAAYIERVGGLTEEETSRFLGVAMLMDLLAALHLVQGVEPWADRLVAGCGSSLSRLS